MARTKIFSINEAPTLPTVFIRINDKRTPGGNIFFRLDKLEEVYTCDNIGLTPEIKINGSSITPTITYEQFINFITEVIDDVNKGIEGIGIYELVVDENTVRDIAPRTQKTKVITPN
ncbi:hypothetical protein [Escherichia coli]|uniref:Uncharacterized protein n=1 Tax=Escherichia coli TaxID=562 RepID=A0AAQ2IA86_ECOLX|nr:hypothetical protein [Escherichia coli]HBC3214748.1 hypothetical protein [Escherichia coli O146]EEC8836662.1 hypothetical protein [Escherichia coli]EEQ2893521.1 hypothetical protein [Escherichia coli]EEQ3191780.1 hypothetical protein [Escherichia coli]EEQ5433250.1 hypothetical protein [Escherichia coli]